VKKQSVAMLLAGGVGTRLGILARKRAKPAIPFGGIYRIIDFTMSNVSRSGIEVVGVLTQYKPLSLMEHIDNGHPWDLFGRTRLVEILPPKTGEDISDWYKGTSDAVYQNLAFIDDFSPELVLIVSGDHIYHMDYRDLYDFHEEKRSDVTVGLIRVPIEQAHQFGTAICDRNMQVVNWEEKPAQPRSNLVSMGIYLFNKKLLDRTLHESARKNGVDFARHIIPLLQKKSRVFGYEFKGYWRDVGTIDAYWNANMDIIRPGSGLDLRNWGIKTNLWVKGEIGDRPAAYFNPGAVVKNSLVSRDCIIKGTVTNSILSPGVVIGRGSVVEDSVIFHDVVIGKNCVIKQAIVDKNVTFGDSIRIGEGELVPNRKTPEQLSGGISVIGKGTRIGSQITIGKSCIIGPDNVITSKKFKAIRSGTTI